MQCSHCHHAVEDPEALFCPACGELLDRTNGCLVCGHPNAPGDRFCSRCGTPVGSTVPRCWTPLYCLESGTAILPGDRHFRCPSCNGTFLERYRDGKHPWCVRCAEKKRSAAAPAGKGKPARPTAGGGKSRRRTAAPEAGEADWAPVAGGVFLMGSPEGEKERFDSEQRHEVQVDSFEMLRTPVTFAMYDAYVKSLGETGPDDEGWGRNDRPVINVDYWSAAKFCRWFSVRAERRIRLPTEAEWEYACRAGTLTPFSTGEAITTDQANFDGTRPSWYTRGAKRIRRDRTTPVTEFPANPWGLFDMHGNVWEWCASEYDYEYGGLELADASRDEDNQQPRVLRGGSWYNTAGAVRSASRNKLAPGLHYLKVGFRVVREA